MARAGANQGRTSAIRRKFLPRRIGTGTDRPRRRLVGALALCGLLAAGGCSSTYPVAKDEGSTETLERGFRTEVLKVGLVIVLGGALLGAATK